MIAVPRAGRPRETSPSVAPWSSSSEAQIDIVEGTAEAARYQVGDLVIRVEADGDEFIATEPQTGMYGEGDDDIHAIMNLLRSLASLRLELRDHADNLSPELAADLDFLERQLWP